MRHHVDRDLLRKHKSDLHPDCPRVFYQWLRYDLTRIIVFCKFTGFSSGPDLILTQSYTSILRLRLVVGDTPDAPHYHFRTRGPSSRHQMPNYTDSSGRLSEDTLSSGEFPEERIRPPRVQTVYASLMDLFTQIQF
ncbi:ribosome production factor 1-like [Dorcoceras hygrometricum]|uniref:Ribosome production factor 1-like n=1 Tax=Dorcoceras hygrometricum TaxID=472368 RepID=A0A2Z7BL09_9LAMI|nr:ribosome production factor 1-like [Dorcoceras hygrometricum]